MTMHMNKRTIHKSDCISLDIFDTLLIRAVDNPEDVFTLLGYECKDIIREKPEEFAAIRKMAGIKAQKDICDEPTIDEIYQCIDGYTEQEKEVIKEKELETERKILFANPQIIELYEECIRANKRIIAVSDMY